METHRNRKPRILTVDNEPSAHATIEALLFREEYDLVFLASGQATPARMGEVDPDVILPWQLAWQGETANENRGGL